MRPDGIWHPRLISVLAAAGHTDLIVVADSGLPIPPGVEAIDLVWRAGEPRFLPVLRAVLAELVVEHVVTEEETAEPGLVSGLAQVLAGVPANTVNHTEFKRITARAKVIVRTGETTPYANVILQAGVPY